MLIFSPTEAKDTQSENHLEKDLIHDEMVSSEG